MNRQPISIFNFQFSIFILLLTASCSNHEVYSESYSFPSETWMRFEPHTFEANIPNSEECYELYVTLDIDTLRYREQALPLTFKVISDQGETRTFFASVMLRSSDGNSLGQSDGQGHLIFRQRVKDYFYFNQPGHYSVSIGQRTSRYEIKGIRKITFTVNKAKLEMPE